MRGATLSNAVNRKSDRFQSTLPVRGATTVFQIHNYNWTFQSTLPVRGATEAVTTATLLVSISIHAPRAGSDDQELEAFNVIRDFNPRSPCGERLSSLDLVQDDSHISIHAPRAGSDSFLLSYSNINRISIHAPRAGSDSIYGISSTYFLISIHAPRAGSDNNTPTNTTKTGDFNPRSPCGERLKLSQLLLCWYLFQSTLPVRGATWTGGSEGSLGIISIHAPRAGSDTITG